MASIMLVVGDSGATTADDDEIQSIIEADGHSTVLHDDGTAPPGTHEDAVVWLCSAADTTHLADWKTEAVPIFVIRGDRADDFGMTGIVGSNGAQTQIEVTDDTHPIAVAAGFSNGLLTLWTSGTRVRESDSVAVDGAVCAVEAVDGTGDMLYTYDSGDTLADSSTAAEARAGFPIHGETGYATDGNADFATLIQETVNWLAPAGNGGGITLPLLHAIQD